MMRRLPRMAVSWTAAFLAKAKPSLPKAYALKSARWHVLSRIHQTARMVRNAFTLLLNSGYGVPT